MTSNTPPGHASQERDKSARDDLEDYDVDYSDTIDYDIDPDALTEDEDGFSPRLIGTRQEQESSGQESPDATAETPWEDVDRDLEGEPGADAVDDELHWYEDEQAEDDWAEPDEPEQGETATDSGLPVPLLVVAGVALLLLVVGGYGVMQERGAMQQEIRQLRATLATTEAAEPSTGTDQALQLAEQRNAGLRASIATLQSENRRLRGEVARLEGLQEARQAALVATAPDLKAAAPAAATGPASKPAQVSAGTAAPASVKKQPETAPVTTAASGNWFVNFGSYSRRPLAESWASRLRPASGTVVVAEGEKDGRPLYRVRVVGLPDASTANAVSRQLEQQHDLPKLWVGQQ